MVQGNTANVVMLWIVWFEYDSTNFSCAVFLLCSCFCLQPVLVSHVDKYLNLDIWTPKSFGEEFG